MPMGNLEISLYGPFVAMLDRDPIEIYAPRCAGHYGSIFTTEKEAPLEHDPLQQGMNNVYAFTQHGIHPNPSTIVRVNPATLLTPPPGFSLSGDLSRAWYCIQLPKPRSVVGIKADPVQVTGTNAPGGPSPYATALRLIYDYDMSKPDVIVSSGGKAVLTTTLQDYSAASPSVASKFDITIRLVGPFLFDPSHDDARECFKATARLFQSGTADLDWELVYQQTQGIVVMGRVGSDCGAVGLVFP